MKRTHDEVACAQYQPEKHVKTSGGLFIRNIHQEMEEFKQQIMRDALEFKQFMFVEHTKKLEEIQKLKQTLSEQIEVVNNLKNNYMLSISEHSRRAEYVYSYVS